jgi:hypothetical protein
MASFTDQIPKFNPYIQQLPVEAMVKVGMEKQRRYDEGIQKIQSYIDNIAGLELSKTVHKQYLQSKLNELGNNLRTVAAGDFSNFQLVNSVGGMVNQITKDPIVQNAVASTQKLKKGDEEVDAARKDGKGSAQNDAWWLKQKNDWLNDGDIKSSFSGQYTPYTDLAKKWMDIQKSLEAEEISRDLPFLQDDQGRFLDAEGNILPPGAKPVLNDVMIRKIFKGKSPQAIKDAITSSMNENDIRQLNIDGWYHYRNTTPTELRGIAASDQNEYIGQLNMQLQNLETLKQLNPSNAQYQNKIDDEIKRVMDDYSNSLTKYNETLSFIDKSPEAFKTAIYAQKTINKFAKDMSNMSEIQQILDNPYQEKLARDRQYQLAVDTYFENVRHHKATEAISWQNYLLSAAEAEAKNKPLTPGPLNIPNLKDMEKITLGAFQADLNSSKQQIDGQKNAFKNTYYKGKEAEFERDYAFHLQQYRNGVETAAEWRQLFDMVQVAQQTYDDGAALLQQIQAEVDAMPEFKGTVSSEETARISAEAERAKSLGLAPAVTIPRGVKVGTKKQMEESVYGKKVAKINEILQQRIVQTYRPETFSFNTGTAQQKDFVKGAFSQYITRIVTSGGQEEAGMTKGYDVAKMQAMNGKDNTRYGTIRQGNQIYLTMEGDEGLQIIKTDVGEFTRVFRYSPVSPVQQVSDDLFKFGSTNPSAGYGFNIKQNPNAYQTARFAKIRGGSALDAFPLVTEYNVKADIIQLPAGNYQTLFYVQDPNSLEWKPRASRESSDLNALRSAMTAMTDANVRLLLK